MISKKYLINVLDDLREFVSGNYIISKEKYKNNMNYACYICLQTLEEYVLINERRYHKSCLENLLNDENLKKFLYENLRNTKKLENKLEKINN